MTWLFCDIFSFQEGVDNWGHELQVQVFESFRSSATCRPNLSAASQKELYTCTVWLTVLEAMEMTH